MKVYSRDDLINKNELNTLNILKGIVHESGIEDCKYKTYFGVLDNAQKGENSYSAMGTIFGRGHVTHSDKDSVVSFLKYYFPECSITMKDMNTSNPDMYIGMLHVSWD